MEPSLKDGSFALVNTVVYWFRRPRVGEVVTFKIPGSGLIYCKRIKSINEGLCELAGDNPADSFDSRKFGQIRLDLIQGKVMTRGGE